MRILVVEDEAGISSSLERGLGADGFAVDVAATGPDGLRLARRHRYDVIVLDIMLPGMDGHEICRCLRDDGDDTPILMLTAKDTDAELAAGLATGADDYVVKPFSYVVLLSRIRALIRRAEQPLPREQLHVGDLRVDLGARAAWVGGHRLDLSPRALSVLAHLMANAGRVVSKQSIVDAVWDHPFTGDPNIVEVYISRIRQALDADAGHAVETVRGHGYRLDPHHGARPDGTGR